ncbi:MAG: glycosyltransferase family 4 protein [Dehalococcoidia bacterium]
MKILHLVQRYSPAVGGSELVFQKLSERLAARGHEVSVWTTDALEIDRFWSASTPRLLAGDDLVNGIPVWRARVRHLGPSAEFYHRLRWLALSLAPLPGALPILRAIAALTPFLPSLIARALSSHERFDLIHAGCLPYDALMIWGETLARRLGVPFLVTPFAHLGRPEDWEIRRHYTMPQQIDLLRRADAVFVQTAFEGDELAARGVPRRAIRRGGAGFEPDEVRRGDDARFRRRHGIEGPIIVFLGVALPEKGALDLLAAVRRLRQGGDVATLVMAGRRTAAFDAAHAALPEAERGAVRVLGPIDAQEKRDLLTAGALLALPSRTESFGIVYFEAWAAGMPVIAAAAGAPAEVVEDGVTGLLVPFGDVPTLAGAILELLSDRALARRLAAAGRKKALASYTWDAVADRVEAVYQDLTLLAPQKREGESGGAV